MPMIAGLHRRVAALIPELAKFGVVGGVGAVIDLGGAAYLHGAMGIGPMVAKGLSISAATVVTYLGSRFWTFRHRVNQHVLRETVLFAALNVVGLLIAEAVIAFTSYGLDMKSTLAYNGASLAGTGLGTIFRYFAYKKWVFLASEPVEAPAPARVPAMAGAGVGVAPMGPVGPVGGRHAARHAGGTHPGGPRHPSSVPARHAAPPRPGAMPGYPPAAPAFNGGPAYGGPTYNGVRSYPAQARPQRWGPPQEQLDPEPF
ncbi:MAG TPA: GtrA family protein [Streptosporangiaceae bacterium]|nr:GtrA family protein [Streptosporangiaceae bacterium]